MSDPDDAPDGFSIHEAGPFLAHAGPLLISRDGTRIGLRVAGRHLNRGGTAHGGLLATLVDTAMGHAVREQADAEAAATVSLTTDYLGPAKEGDWVEASTEVERLGGRLAFVDCSLRVEDREVVRARAVFTLLDG
jgi:acyl-coenzyme A thioesterase 13